MRWLSVGCVHRCRRKWPGRLGDQSPYTTSRGSAGGRAGGAARTEQTVRESGEGVGLAVPGDQTAVDDADHPVLLPHAGSLPGLGPHGGCLQTLRVHRHMLMARG
jgi:hypothetical protein